MTDTLQCIDAICALAAKGMPSLEKIYIDLVPVQFERPCLLVQMVSRSVTDAAAALVRIIEKIVLTVFDTTDDYSQSDTRSLLALQGQAMALFRPGRLVVGDRSITAKATSSGREWDRAFVELQLEFFDLRDEMPDLTPLMQTIETNMRLRKDDEKNGVTFD